MAHATTAKLRVVNARRSAVGKSRWSALAATVVISAGMLYAQVNERPRRPPAPTASATPPTSALPTPAASAHTATPEEVGALAANAPVAAQQFQLALSAGVASEDRLQVKTIWAARTISVLFPQITTIYGWREDPLPWHPKGLAIDVMIPNHDTPEGIELGDQIAGYALANARLWGINHVIWRQKIYPGVGAGSWTANFRNETLNHYDHVHIATDGGGYPTGRETYFIGSMTPAPPN